MEQVTNVITVIGLLLNEATSQMSNIRHRRLQMNSSLILSN